MTKSINDVFNDDYFDVAKAKQALYSDLLELIGEDLVLFTSHANMQMLKIANQDIRKINKFKATQRQALKEYFNL